MSAIEHPPGAQRADLASRSDCAPGAHAADRAPDAHGADRAPGAHGADRAPGDDEFSDHDVGGGIRGYLLGLGLATMLTAASFYVASGSSFIWTPGVPIMLVVFAVAQMGVHLVFFLHITTGPDNTNNVLALAFGVLIVVLLLAGSLWIMANLNHNMMPMNEIMKMQR